MGVRKNSFLLPWQRIWANPNKTQLSLFYVRWRVGQLRILVTNSICFSNDIFLYIGLRIGNLTLPKLFQPAARYENSPNTLSRNTMAYVRLDPTIIHRAKHPMMASRYLRRHRSVTLKITLPPKFGKALWRNIALRLNFCFFWFLIRSVTPSFSVEHSRPFLWKLAVIQSSYLKSLDLLNPWDQLIADTARELKLTFQRGWLLKWPHSLQI